MKELTHFVLEVALESNPRIKLELRADSSSARLWAQRRGLGRLRHVNIRLCHLQDSIRNSVLSVFPVNTKLNVADLSTKKLSKSLRESLLYYCGSIEVEGDLVRTGNHEIEQRYKKKFKEMAFDGAKITAGLGLERP